MRVWKRCVAALLACMMLCSTVSVGFAAGTIDGETGIWTATAAEIVAERYGVDSDKYVMAMYENAAVDSGMEYTVQTPHANGTEGESDLIVVDYQNKIIYVRDYCGGEYTWIPTEVTLYVDGEEKEHYVLVESVCYYQNMEYFACQPFAYDGKSYTVEATYELTVEIDLDEQQRILDIPAHLRQAVSNIDTTLAKMRSDLALLGQEIPTLHSMLTMSFPPEGEEDPEPFFDEEEHAAEIETIIALFAEYTKNAEEPQLDMLAVAVDCWNSELDDLAYAMQSGQKVQATAAALYEKLQILDGSTQLRSLLSKIRKIDTDLHTSLKNFFRRMDKLMDPLETLSKGENWMILSEEVQQNIFVEEYTEEDLDKLSGIASGLRSYLIPEAEDVSIVAAKRTISCEVVTHDVTVCVNASVVDEGIGNDTVIPLDTYTAVVRVLDGVDQDELDAIVDATGVEQMALDQWNALSENYKISTGHYHRTQTAIDGVLHSDIDYIIHYEPNYYEVDTNYGVSLSVPFGYLLELPECVDSDGWYDYRVSSDGGEITYNQGTVFAVESDLEITRTTGTAKFEYRVLDFVAEDTQYAMSDIEKEIFYNAALISPMVRVRLPGDNIGSVIETGTGFYVEANSMASGMRGMSWEIDEARLYDLQGEGDNEQEVLVEELIVENGKVAWETAGFTHVIFDHSMQVTRVRDGIGSRELTAEEINEYVNLPYTLSEKAGQQNRDLGGDGRDSAKTILTKMAPYESILGMLSEDYLDYMNTVEAKNAILRLIGSESEKVKGLGGVDLGYGGWSDYADMPALYYYLKQCKNAGWSLVTYYQQEYYTDLAKQALLMAECLEAIVNDSGFVASMEFLGKKDVVTQLKSIIPDLISMSGNMKGPDTEYMDVHHTQFSALIADLLAAEGEVKQYPEASTLYAYETVRRNGKNFGVLQVTVQKGDIQRSMTIDYKMNVVDGSERYYVVKENDKRFIVDVQNFVAEAEAALNIDAEEKLYYDLCMSRAFPSDGEHLKGDISILLIYTPKTYTVTVKSGEKETILETFTYTGRETKNYPINLPAKSKNSEDPVYYEYTFYDANGKVLDVVAVENGSVGHFYFEREWLPELFSNESYTIYRKECKEESVPFTTLVPTLSTEWIRGYVDDSDNKDTKRFYLDALPDGLTYDRFMEQVDVVQENGKVGTFEILDLEGELLSGTQLVGTGMTVRHEMVDVFGNKIKGNLDGCILIMMGDVNGDGLCDNNDVNITAGAYYLDVTEKTDYMKLLSDNLGLDEAEALAANMNNNTKIDSNDAWTIRSKYLCWDGNWDQGQMIYRSVLRR